MSQKLWSAAGLSAVPPGSVLTHLDGQPVSSFSQAANRGLETKSPRLRFSTPEGGTVEVPVGTTSVLPLLGEDGGERGWAGMSPVPQIDSIADGAPSEAFWNQVIGLLNLRGWPGLLLPRFNPSCPTRRTPKPPSSGGHFDQTRVASAFRRKVGHWFESCVGSGSTYGQPTRTKIWHPTRPDGSRRTEISSNSPNPSRRHLSPRFMADTETYSIDLTQEDRDSARP